MVAYCAMVAAKAALWVVFACAGAWPPVIGTPHAGGTAMSADLGTTTRPDGTTQVTYKGHPLYTYIKDKDNGDAYGQNAHAFGADWYVRAADGTAIQLDPNQRAPKLGKGQLGGHGRTLGYITFKVPAGSPVTLVYDDDTTQVAFAVTVP